jgi:5-hydroxyisourate hydrolase-like protein (transthyretin family)
MRTVILALSICAGVFIFSEPASACSGEVPAFCRRLSSSRVIFTARAHRNLEPHTVRLVVEERFQGVPNAEAEIEGLEGGPCGMPLEDGERYLIFTSHPRDSPYVLIELHSGSELASIAGAEIAYLRDWSHGKTVTSVMGKVIDDEGVPMADATVTIASAGRQWTIQSDAEGHYVIANVPPGTYTAAAERVNFSPAYSKREAEIIPGGCGELDIRMSMATRIGGHVEDADGHPAALIDVDLMRIERNELLMHRRYITDADGSFMIENLRRGTYVLQVGAETGTISETPYDLRFYPGVESIEDSEKIEISGPTNLDNLVFRLGPKHATRQIRINVVWDNGQPVGNALVSCRNSSGNPEDQVDAPTDLQGHALCEVLADRDYEVIVSQFGWRGADPVIPAAETAHASAGMNPLDLTLRIPFLPTDDAKPHSLAYRARQPGRYW